MAKYAPDMNVTQMSVRPMLEYIGGSNLLLLGEEKEERISMKTPWPVIDEQISAALKHWDLVVIAERYEDSLAVLMHALQWRLVDLVGLPINVQARASSKTALLQARLREDKGSKREEFEWMMKVDSLLYERANKRLDEQVREVPGIYKGVQEGVRMLTKRLGEKCKVSSTGKHYSREDRECVTMFREEVLAEVGREMEGDVYD